MQYREYRDRVEGVKVYIKHTFKSISPMLIDKICEVYMQLFPKPITIYFEI